MAKKYSASERKAFHMGRAWAAGKDGERIACPDEKTKKSFRNGVKATRKRQSGGGKKSAQTKAQCANCGSPLYVVDGNGTVVDVIKGGKK